MPTLTTLVNFNGTNGEFSAADLIADSAGDLSGDSDGTVFEIATSFVVNPNGQLVDQGFTNAGADTWAQPLNISLPRPRPSQGVQMRQGHSRREGWVAGCQEAKIEGRPLFA